MKRGRLELRDLLLESGTMTPDWVPAFEAVPRELFLPDVMWPSITDEHIAVSRSDDPVEWRLWADADVPIVTQWDDGHHIGPEPGERPTSSSSMPGAVFAMLRDLSVFDGARVLEIGTGTGWCAGLLSARLGEANVVSVELDEAVAETAREALVAAGWHPRLVVGDGLLGWPEGAPYDRILVTAGVRRVPRAWIEQTRPGGVIVMPWGPVFTGQNAVVRLVVGGDGSAGGRFGGAAGFMHVRSQRVDWNFGDYLPGGGWPEDTRESVTALTEADVLPDGPYSAVEFVLGLLVPGCVYTYGRNLQDRQTMWLFGLTDLSWAVAFFNEGDPARSNVYQGGPRSLWDEVEAAHSWWIERGRPRHEEFGLTVTVDGRQEVWLGKPSELVPQAVPAR
ncbi:methyltransferase domain-containing protein [Streptosporangium sp. NPDC051022]|uniref:methyltransferase domain-containing protein n=1 Tax=Streptosporangium sp. NPDC051022 TaxID=3155752 RepID=UPI0034291A0B